MSSRILFIILATLLFLSSFTAATVENLDEREPSSNYTVTPFGIEIGPVNKNVDTLAAYSFDSDMQHDNTSISFDVSQTRLENSTRIISSFGERKIESKNAAEASLFIKDEMEKAGLQVSPENFSARVRTRDFNYWNVSGTNVVGIKEGKALKDEVILVTAHYDSRIIVPPEAGLKDIFDSEIRKPYLWPVWSDTYVCESANGTGADDNAGGVACMLELARVLQNESFDRTIYFIAFSGEENTIFLAARPGLKPILS
ncbi:M28 family metallopeptidase [Methanosarcina sp.]|uniref:M28 family metallopeptidase n=1 Tax=Methanosarcina sp. TaxID=2213 RepID=UPI002988CE76|nr:M28 family peptidase [Methanosarcina sp.]MDW5551306.1 M28 family peptidase [Methanosarcina sp.]MDW5555208.1 M28 family peptidase [Methanosarcina sp.]MDW5560893.1 M28 family peptidase [Methanosarcina sp.]